MSSIKLTKLHFSEIKQEICTEFGVVSSENHIALQCSNNQLIVLDPLDSSAFLTDLPYNICYMEIPQNAKTSLKKKAQLRQCYTNSNLLEQQELVLKPSCVANFSCEPLKVNALQFKLAPWNAPIQQPFAVIVTVSGLCRILKKMTAPSRQWIEICNVNEYFINQTLFSNKANTENFSNISLNEFCITAATWHTTEPILFVSLENGCIAILIFCNIYTLKLKKLFIEKTTLGKICDINSFDQYLLASSRDGTLQLFSVIHATTNAHTLTPFSFLWRKRDNMMCSKILVKMFSPGIHLVVFTKGAHILVNILNVKGQVICSTKLYIGGIKVTGVQFISPSELIVTTIAGTVRYLRVEFLDNSELRIKEENIKIDLGTPNLGILGLVASSNCSLLTFILLRSAEYSQQCKYMHSSIFLNVLKLERVDILKELTSRSLSAFNPIHDYVIALGMDVFNNMNYGQYRSFSDMMLTELPDILDDGFLLQLQIKFVLVSNLLNSQRLKQKKNKESTIIAHTFLYNSIQITHIICRLKHLCSLESTMLSSFQRTAINIFMKKYAILIRNVKNLIIEDSFLELMREKYLSFFAKSSNIILNEQIKSTAWNERCLYCNDRTNPHTMTCAANHKVNRCNVAYIQLPIISSRHCPRCQSYVLEDESLLQQLFPANEILKCTFCRFLFVEDCI